MAAKGELPCGHHASWRTPSGSRQLIDDSRSTAEDHDGGAGGGEVSADQGKRRRPAPDAGAAEGNLRTGAGPSVPRTPRLLLRPGEPRRPPARPVHRRRRPPPRPGPARTRPPDRLARTAEAGAEDRGARPAQPGPPPRPARIPEVGPLAALVRPDRELVRAVHRRPVPPGDRAGQARLLEDHRGPRPHRPGRPRSGRPAAGLLPAQRRRTARRGRPERGRGVRAGPRCHGDHRPHRGVRPGRTVRGRRPHDRAVRQG